MRWGGTHNCKRKVVGCGIEKDTDEENVCVRDHFVGSESVSGRLPVGMPGRQSHISYVFTVFGSVAQNVSEGTSTGDKSNLNRLHWRQKLFEIVILVVIDQTCTAALQ